MRAARSDISSYARHGRLLRGDVHGPTTGRPVHMRVHLLLNEQWVCVLRDWQATRSVRTTRTAATAWRRTAVKVNDGSSLARQRRLDGWQCLVSLGARRTRSDLQGYGHRSIVSQVGVRTRKQSPGTSYAPCQRDQRCVGRTGAPVGGDWSREGRDTSRSIGSRYGGDSTVGTVKLLFSVNSETSCLPRAMQRAIQRRPRRTRLLR